jgi:hypothetical protein
MSSNQHPPISNDNQIVAFFHCGACVAAGRRQRLEAGWTPRGLQVWCKACDNNVINIDFEGDKHPAVSTRRRGPDDPLPPALKVVPS